MILNDEQVRVVDEIGRKANANRHAMRKYYASTVSMQTYAVLGILGGCLSLHRYWVNRKVETFIRILVFLLCMMFSPNYFIPVIFFEMFAIVEVCGACLHKADRNGRLPYSAFSDFFTICLHTIRLYYKRW